MVIRFRHRTTWLEYGSDISPQSLLAQVTVINADYGDSNIIDMYQFAPGQEANYSTPSLRRSLIDTGPPSDLITNAIMDALVNRALPKPVASIDPDIIPPLNELQITHTDQDHIGNAVAVLRRLQHGNLPAPPQKLVVRFTDIPPALPTVHAEFVRAEVIGVNHIRLDIELDGFWSWIDKLKEITIDTSQPAKAALIIKDIQTSNHIFGTKERSDDSMILRYVLAISTIKEFIDLITAKKVDGIFKFGFPYVTHYLGFAISEVVLIEFPLSLTLHWILSFIGATESQKLFKRTHLVQTSTRPSGAWNYKNPGVRKEVSELEEALKIVYVKKRITHERPAYNHTIDRQRINAQPSNDNDVTQVIVGPLEDVHRLRQYYDVVTFLNQRILSRGLAPHDRIYETEIESTIVNRASIVTIFSRREADFDMLFTGDAYDQTSDIRQSIMMWKLGLVKAPLFKFSVVKIPHHGSELTTHAQFYQAVRADVYIICAQHSKHGNPRVSSLKAIVEGFRDNPRPNDKNYLLFFSDPKALKDTPRYLSRLRILLQMDYYKPSNSLKYECWVLKDNPPLSVRQSYGSILFYSYRVGNKNFVGEFFSLDEWERATID